MNRTLRIFVACALGAFIGSIIALQMGHMFWWIGTLIGAGVAYIGYNLNEVILAIPIAWRRATSWRPDYEWWKAYRIFVQATLNNSVNILLLFFAMVALMLTPLVLLATTKMELVVGYIKFAGIAVVGVSVGLTLISAIDGLLVCNTRELTHSTTTKPFPDNPIKFWLWSVPKGVLQGISWLITHVPTGFKIAVAVTPNVVNFVKKFSVELFRLVHSELRLLCAVDAAIGTTVGYFTGSAIIGALAGGLLGVVNYEIITIRVLKLAGAKSVFR